VPGAAAAGDLYERYSRQIFGYCLHQLGSREEAEDAVQTTFMNAFRGLQRGIVPELECYDAGHVESCLTLAKEGVIGLPAHFDFVLGVRGGLGASEENLKFLLTKLPQGCSFSVAGIGRHQLPMAELSLRLGGHARCGLEDNIYLSKGVLAKGSWELVARVAELARAAGREVATPAQARKMLRIRAVALKH
jgi:3-keto-5-aminohexanoate cleavage enzyme